MHTTYLGGVVSSRGSLLICYIACFMATFFSVRPRPIPFFAKLSLTLLTTFTIKNIRKLREAAKKGICKLVRPTLKRILCFISPSEFDPLFCG